VTFLSDKQSLLTTLYTSKCLHVQLFVYGCHVRGPESSVVVSVPASPARPGPEQVLRVPGGTLM
jgi:hypothetical protein